MARRKSFSSMVNQLAREQARRERQSEAERKREIREQEKAAKEAIRIIVIQNKEAKQQYLQARQSEVEERNQELTDIIEALKGILEFTFSVDDAIDFNTLRIRDGAPVLSIPADLQQPLEPPNKSKFLEGIKAPNAITKLVPGVMERYQKALQKAEENYLDALRNFEKEEEKRKSEVRRIEEAHEIEKQRFLGEVQQRDQEVTELEDNYRNLVPEAVIAYNILVLERSEYPDGFPHEFRLAYVPESKELIIEYELPNVNIVPIITEYKYVKTKDVIDEKLRKAAEIKELYQDVIASIALRTIHEVFEADVCDALDVAVFNGFVQTVDPATGKDIRPYLISVRATKSTFKGIDLRRVDKRACLRNLGAMVSPRAAEMQPVKPIVEFAMVDKRFVEESDVLSDLDGRPNLMDLTPFEFENLVTNLFNRMGLDTKLTQSSKDGGVDAVAFDTRPIIGGKIVIQAKRYKNVVGVSAVRDLSGTMQHEGANKGILVTTSHYGPDAYDFAKGKPIELIDGGGLLYLLEQVGVKARIVFPED